MKEGAVKMKSVFEILTEMCPIKGIQTYIQSRKNHFSADAQSWALCAYWPTCNTCMPCIGPVAC